MFQFDTSTNSSVLDSEAPNRYLVRGRSEAVIQFQIQSVSVMDQAAPNRYLVRGRFVRVLYFSEVLLRDTEPELARRALVLAVGRDRSFEIVLLGGRSHDRLRARVEALFTPPPTKPL
jgi:hypothetical protein